MDTVICDLIYGRRMASIRLAVTWEVGPWLCSNARRGLDLLGEGKGCSEIQEPEISRMGGICCQKEAKAEKLLTAEQMPVIL